jgi:sarcosine oxidase, subunit gamma
MSDLTLNNPLDTLAAAARSVPAAALELVQARARFSFRARDAGAISAAGDAFGAPLPQAACRFTTATDRRALWLGPDEWLLVAPLASGPELQAALDRALAGTPHALVDVSHRSVSFTISGPKAAEVLNSGCPLDLSLYAFPVATCTRTVLGKSEIVLLRTEEDKFQLDVWRSFAPYAWAYLDDARRELG